MKEQYVGDINDYRKYALLRALSREGKVRIGVAWMLTPPDGRPDGNKVDYLKQPERYRDQDPALFDLLASVVGEEGPRRLRDIEKSGIIPEALYFNEYLPDQIDRRRAWFEVMAKVLDDADLVFFDPDNGLDISSTRKGTKNSSKFLYRDEVAETYGRGHSVLLYQHFTRETRDGFIARLSTDLKGLAPDAAVWAFRTAHTLFLLLVHPAHAAMLGAAAEEAAGRWDAGFMVGARV